MRKLPDKFFKKENYYLKGRIIKGEGEARTLGFPTANLKPHDNHIINNMKDGVHSCYVTLSTNTYKGMCYLDKKRRQIIEVHIFNFEGDLYNHNISITFKHHIRKPVNGISIEDIKELIHKDAILCLLSLD